MTSIEFSQDELKALVGLMDAAVRASGLQSVVAAAVLIQKIENAAKPAADNVIDMKEAV